MWRYKCKRYLLYLLVSFLAGAALTFFAYREANLDLLTDMVPAQAVELIRSNPFLVYLSGGLSFAGICNIFVVGSFLYSEFGVPVFMAIFFFAFFPSMIIAAGILLLPVSVIVLLYGWISLARSQSYRIQKRNKRNEDELVRIYLIHHPMEKQYEVLGEETRKNIDKVNLALVLGIIAATVLCFVISNILVLFLVGLVFIFIYQYLARYRASLFLPISKLLYQDCNPQACASALLAYCRRGDHYRLVDQPLLAQSLIYMDDPSLAQDFLNTYARPNVNAELTYWSIMGYIYYQLADENGLQRTYDTLMNIKTKNQMNLFIKNQEMQAVHNKIQLMNGDFNAAKAYYLNQLKRNALPLIQVDCNYYIGLISFVQKDFSLARAYFEKVVSHGNKLYFVEKARGYLSQIDKFDLSNDDLDHMQSP